MLRVQTDDDLSDTEDLELEVRDLEDNAHSAQAKLADCQIMLERAREENRSVTEEHDALEYEVEALTTRVEDLQLMYSSEKLAFQRFRERCRAPENSQSTKEQVRDWQQECLHLQACIDELQRENDSLRTDNHANEWMQLLRKCRELRQARSDLEHNMLERNLRVHDGHLGMMYTRPKCLHENRKLRRRNADLRARLAHYTRVDEVREAGTSWTGQMSESTRESLKSLRGLQSDEKRMESKQNLQLLERTEKSSRRSGREQLSAGASDQALSKRPTPSAPAPALRHDTGSMQLGSMLQVHNRKPPPIRTTQVTEPASSDGSSPNGSRLGSLVSSRSSDSSA